MVKRGWKALTGVLFVLLVFSVSTVFYLKGRSSAFMGAVSVAATLTFTPTVPTTSPTATPLVVTPITRASGEFREGWETAWYRSSLTNTDHLVITGTLETFAEPGVLLDNTAIYDYMSAVETTPILVPEAGYAYIAIGAVTLSHNGDLNLYHREGNIYLVIIRGLPEDGIAADFSQVVMATDYVRATGIYSSMPAGAYVSLEWMLQQVQAAFRSPNCGGGCQQVTIVVVDLQTHTYRAWVVKDPKNSRNWVRIN